MRKVIIIVFSIILLLFPTNESTVCKQHHFYKECKLIMAVGNATKGNYSILLKVRDPARAGWQVLCHIPRGYEYDYHHPWFGYKLHFVVEHSFIGTTTLYDTPPNITKPGMLINDAGIALADADTISYFVNPSIFAWDDFDWLRYAAQYADNIEEAVKLLIDVVDKFHATSVAENIFVVDANKGIIVEADAFNYRIKEVKDGIEIRSNYPKMLWNIHFLYPLFTASKFNETFFGWVKEKEIVKLGSLLGIYIAKIGNDYVRACLYPVGISKKIKVGEGVVIGNFWLELFEIKERKARIYLCFKYYEWERKLKEIVEKRYGKIDVNDAMKWSRLHDLEVRAMCEGGYEAATIYKIPKDYPEILSCIWFAPNQCSSIFVPIHICSFDIYDAYENGEAHRIAAKLLEKYGHGNLTKIFEEIEKDFINETKKAEEKALCLLNERKEQEAKLLLTLSDIKLQIKAIAIEKMLLGE